MIQTLCLLCEQSESRPSLARRRSSVLRAVSVAQSSILGNQKLLEEIVKNQHTILAHVAKN